jgi:hypothetical protein
MKRLLWSLCFLPYTIFSQQTGTGATEEQLLENLAAATDMENEDDSDLQLREYYRRHPISLNTTTGADLRELRLLSEIQINNIISYRLLLGRFIDLYELQAVPGLDIATIKRLLPFVALNESETNLPALGKMTRNGEHGLLLRTTMALEKAKGYTAAASGEPVYKGSRSKLFVRYQYRFKRQLEYGILGEKDAGEQFFKGTQRYGFDFYSFYLFLRKQGIVDALAIGDFSVSLGQGLIQAQGLSLRKSAGVLSSRSLAQVLKPYHSAGEYNFHRGLALTLKKAGKSLTIFGSYRKHSANLDAVENGFAVSSISSSGYHRTDAELQQKNNFTILTAGASLKFQFTGGHIAANTVQYRFSYPLKPSGGLYDIYSIEGNTWSNYSIDYAYTFGNLHAYGELAADRLHQMALVQGIMISLHKKLDLSVVYRNLGKRYQSMFSSTFSESSSPRNERGLFIGVGIRPGSSLNIETYADVYRFPWLKFRVGQPSSGYDYTIRCTYTPDKRTTLFMSYRNETKGSDLSSISIPLKYIAFFRLSSFRTQVSYQFSREILFRTRFDISAYKEILSPDALQHGFLCFSDLQYKPENSIISGNFRLQYFDTDGYESRLYAYESGMQYDFSIPAYFNKGWRYYLNLKIGLGPVIRKLGFKDIKAVLALQTGQQLMGREFTIGSGNDEIAGNKRTEWRAQLLLSW